MSSFKPFSIDTLTGIKHSLAVDSLTNEMYVKTEQDVTKILDENKRQQYDAKGTLGKADLVKVGTIPLGLIEHWKATEGLDIYKKEHWPRVVEKLNSNEFQALRVAQFKV
jgi:hypothetical protein